MKKTLSAKKSAWMTPDGRPFGQRASWKAISSAMRCDSPGEIVSARAPAASASGRQPATESGFGRRMAKPLPASCSSASARPAARQCATVGFFTESPSR